ncbi:MFS transporter [Luteipulveratus halotolerans]|uniref:MFS transporter n=1 Tax=Luteipulveratus halotolerans TaxID=1631356 RepID=A0A0L6CLW8_9MICO|nr:MFS transporter [Luteipulveratus halotolerans]KNX38747.1 hypothetical protein VV01_18955 [Luteipulveratus halotolerans]
MTSPTTSSPPSTASASQHVLRLLIVIQLVSMSGRGVFFAVGALYFTQVVGLDVQAVGLALTVAGGVGVIATYVAGLASDRWPARTLMVLALLVEGAALAALPWCDTIGVYAVLAGIEAAMSRGCWTARQTLLARAFTGADRTPARAKMRVATNLGIGLGSGLAALVLADGRAGTFRWAMTLAALMYLFAAYAAVRVPADRPSPAGVVTTAETVVAADDDVLAPWRNRRYLATAAINGAVVTHFAVVEVGLPVWLVTRTSAPPVLVSVLLALNTAVIVLLQVRLNRGFENPRTAASGFLRGGLLLASACGAYALAPSAGAVVASLVLIAGGLVHAVGEILTSGAGFSLGYELADERAMGRYQGFFGAAQSVGMMLGPVLVASVVAAGWWAWVALGVLYAGLAVAGYVTGRRTTTAAAPATATVAT